MKFVELVAKEQRFWGFMKHNYEEFRLSNFLKYE
jgi:hypothetical protein